MIDLISELIKKNLLPPHIRKQPIEIKYFLHTAPAFFEEGKNVFFAFLDNDSTPYFTITLVQNKAGQEELLISEKLAPILNGHIVRPLFSFPVDNSLLIFYKYIPSFSFLFYPEKKKKELLLRSFELILEITDFFLGANGALWPKEALIATIKKEIILFNPDTNLLKKLEADIRNLELFLLSQDLRKIPQHGDYSIVNLRFKEKEIYIFDLAHFFKTAIPFYDIVSFLLSLFTDKTWVAHANLRKWILCNVYPDFIEKYASLIKVNKETFSKLFPFLLIMRFNYYNLPSRNNIMGEIIYKIIKTYYGEARKDCIGLFRRI